MVRRRVLLVAGSFFTSLLSACVLSLLVASGAPLRAAAPDRLSDQEFWKLSVDSSEPDGTFRSENLLSNELGGQWVIPSLVASAKQGRVYMGVGPEQNFAYIAALKPSMAFIIDIRRGNLELQLMYKALFELSADRAEFVSRLFSKKRPEGLTSASTALDIFTAYERVPTSEPLFNENLKAIEDLLTKKHGLPMTAKDIDGLEWVYQQFYLFGPSINYNSAGGGFGGGGGYSPTYADLMVATDGPRGVERGYLSSDERFGVVK